MAQMPPNVQFLPPYPVKRISETSIPAEQSTPASKPAGGPSSPVPQPTNDHEQSDDEKDDDEAPEDVGNNTGKHGFGVNA